MFQLIAFVFALALLAAPAKADTADGIAAMAPSGLVLVLDEDGEDLVAQNTDEAFVPASVAKLVTAWLAMEVLGGDYRFKTKFYMDEDRVLYVRGGGDPFLVSEEFALLAPKLVDSVGEEPLKRVVLDASYFPDDLQIPGIEATDEAYDARNAAFAANFNTIHAERRGSTVRSAEEQTPITPLAIEQFLAHGPAGRGRISLAQEDPKVGLLYAGELLIAFIERAGGDVEGELTTGSVPDELKPVYVHEQSRPLSEIVGQMLLGSNNYIANQLFLEVGAHRRGSPVSLEKSLDVAQEELAELELIDAIQLVEGSGISRDNRFTARGLAVLLDDFRPHAELLRSTRAGSRYKTGTFSGVRTLAGFARTSNHGDALFVISLTGNTGKLRFRILSAIERGF
ncbi:Peptidase S13, D-Ala-D-Ala carboxypeptidase C [Fulvimarina pelagi HTCC2506]|uniref:Peptidase S13, D-Ala-D-Ala carboxypeptidase C n=1 Tax=Fulvimarina pelagi HTCC2506 TaxID=314231 RepID=Q0FY12_9HYPH|nr:D-alanyl-D-alanine carboxypeptidase [Fulvimarina pelagi]EAU39930.1 Peptidase S13, D-Ala-D-Ala carboxypeptidase C [Fulvimarina pelagi HTCC2506]